MKTSCFALITAFVLLLPVLPAASSPPPDDFPRFQVLGHQPEMDTLRELFWLHYPGSGPKSTLWDEWLTDASLWPATLSSKQSDNLRQAWRDTLSGRHIDSEGYVATHQHASIAHQHGWPFPFWNQGRRGFGWHFSFKNTVDRNWRPHDLSQTTGWSLQGGITNTLDDEGLPLSITNNHALILPHAWKCDSLEVPFIQIRWKVAGLSQFSPCIEWTTPGDTIFTPTRRIYFEAPKADTMVYTMVPMYKHPLWTGEVAQVRIALGNTQPGQVTLQALFSQYDTRHNINEPNFIRGCAKYFWWTQDLQFLRDNIQRMRMALRFTGTEHRAFASNVVHTTWIGHDGRSGLVRRADGSKEIRTGLGIGNNYWDLMPFGNLDCYATIQYYDALRAMEAIEREIQLHPEWLIPGGALAFSPDWLADEAAAVKTTGNNLFWDATNGRFVAAIDSEGKRHDYGYTFLNCEAIYYDFASPDHARQIMEWIDGRRIVEGDTSTGKDIYFWRFGPRASTRRNLDWYFWAWNAPESIPWGGQVQDGGAVMGFSYHDLVARIKVLGPDNAWSRLQEITKWFSEVQAEGGYRAYYDGKKRPGALQGGGTPGGLGLDHEFFESALVPQVMLHGFLGFRPTATGFSLDPKLPASWPELTITHIRLHDAVFTLKASRDTVTVETQVPGAQEFTVTLPKPWPQNVRMKWQTAGTIKKADNN